MVHTWTFGAFDVAEQMSVADPGMDCAVYLTRLRFGPSRQLILHSDTTPPISTSSLQASNLSSYFLLTFHEPNRTRAIYCIHSTMFYATQLFIRINLALSELPSIRNCHPTLPFRIQYNLTCPRTFATHSHPRPLHQYLCFTHPAVAAAQITYMYMLSVSMQTDEQALMQCVHRVAAFLDSRN
jgi:hypothetical protein